MKVDLVAYRDRGDAYVTQITPLTEDLDKVYSNLMDFEAAGGGDTPEDVRRALSEGVGKAGWSKPRTGLAQIVFLVGDAPPHAYENEPDVIASARQAVNNQIVVNTIHVADKRYQTRLAADRPVRSGQIFCHRTGWRHSDDRYAVRRKARRTWADNWRDIYGLRSRTAS